MSATVEYRQSPSFPDLLIGSDGSIVTSKGVTLLQQPNGRQGYLGICRRVNGLPRRFQSHLLVCEAFHGERPEGLVARHLNGQNTDNRASNLTWGTYAQNAEDSRLHGTMAWGERAGNVVLTEALAYEIRRRYDAGESPVKIAQDMPVCESQVRRVGKREAWAMLPEETSDTTVAA